MTEIWESRTSDGVIHGEATRYIAWKLDSTDHWHMMGAFWSRADAEAALQ